VSEDELAGGRGLGLAPLAAHHARPMIEANSDQLAIDSNQSEAA
jgi:hypothetical protein